MPNNWQPQLNILKNWHVKVIAARLFCVLLFSTSHSAATKKIVHLASCFVYYSAAITFSPLKNGRLFFNHLNSFHEYFPNLQWLGEFSLVLEIFGCVWMQRGGNSCLIKEKCLPQRVYLCQTARSHHMANMQREFLCPTCSEQTRPWADPWQCHLQPI